MQALKTIGSAIKNVMLVFSFIVSLVLVIVLVVLGLMIFDIKNNVASPLLVGLHSSFVGLDEATIDWTIPVRDTIPVRLNIPLDTDTVVTLTQSVPLTVNAVITLPGVGVLNNAQVNLQLPAGLELPVHLDLNVPVDEQLPVAIDVRAVIPIQQTQLHDPIDNLRLTFEPIIRALGNLPNNFDEGGAFVQALLSGDEIDLLAETDYSRDPWAGYSTTAGVGYPLADAPLPATAPLETGIVPLGGIPALDEMIRPDVYAEGAPVELNAQAIQALIDMGLDPAYFDGSYSATLYQDTRQPVTNQPAVMPIDTYAPDAPPSGNGDLGILPPPSDAP